MGLAAALGLVASQMGRRIVMPIHASGARFILDRRIPSVKRLQDWTGASQAGIAVLEFDGLRQATFADLITRADVVINRAVQANSFPETILAGRPQLVITMPAAGYMDSELMADKMPCARCRYDEAPEKLAGAIGRLLFDEAARNACVKSLRSMLHASFAAPGANFGCILAQAIGIDFPQNVLAAYPTRR
jgi:UDP-N-acetylglucosamine:LPS N-acetylglucosamine transferase